MQLLGSVCLLRQGLHTFPETSFGVSVNSTGCLVFDMVLQLQSQSLGVVASVSSYIEASNHMISINGRIPLDFRACSCKALFHHHPRLIYESLG